jgi:hypothetical protein
MFFIPAKIGLIFPEGASSEASTENFWSFDPFAELTSWDELQPVKPDGSRLHTFTD